ncbi:MAG: hypothetical protein V1820_03830 [archaeon]
MPATDSSRVSFDAFRESEEARIPVAGELTGRVDVAYVREVRNIDPERKNHPAFLYDVVASWGREVP